MTNEYQASIEDKITEYEVALKSFADLVNQQNFIHSQVAAARTRLNQAKEELRIFELDVHDILAIREQVKLQEIRETV